MVINIKNRKALLKKVVIGRAVTALKQQKSKGKGEEKGIAEIVHNTKPITRSPDSSSSSKNNSNNNIIIIINNNNIIIIIKMMIIIIIIIIIIMIIYYYYFLVLPLLLQFPKGLERLEENIDKC
jgi:ATP-dependent Zn protease